MRRTKPMSIYPDADLRNRLERFALSKERPASYVACKLIDRALQRIERKTRAAGHGRQEEATHAA